jgi:hypothetical protein
MAEMVREWVVKVVGEDGHTFALVRAMAEEMPGGTWAGWLEFVTPDGERVVTERETTQSKLEDVAYWASGLEAVYVEGALQRALEARAG